MTATKTSTLYGNELVWDGFDEEVKTLENALYDRLKNDCEEFLEYCENNEVDYWETDEYSLSKYFDRFIREICNGEALDYFLKEYDIHFKKY